MFIFLISLPVPDLTSISTNTLIRLPAAFFCLSYTQYVLLVTNFPCLLSPLCPWNFKCLFFILSIRLLVVSIFSKIPLYLHALVFSVSFCRTSLLTQVSSRHELPVWHVSFTYSHFPLQGMNYQNHIFLLLTQSRRERERESVMLTPHLDVNGPPIKMSENSSENE